MIINIVDYLNPVLAYDINSISYAIPDFLSVFFLDFNTIMLVIYHKHGIL